VSLVKNVKRFRGGLVSNAHRLAYHSTLGFGEIKKKKEGRNSSIVCQPASHVTDSLEHLLISTEPSIEALLKHGRFDYILNLDY
jgi:hypothetical protein